MRTNYTKHIYTKYRNRLNQAPKETNTMFRGLLARKVKQPTETKQREPADSAFEYFKYLRNARENMYD